MIIIQKVDESPMGQSMRRGRDNSLRLIITVVVKKRIYFPSIPLVRNSILIIFVYLRLLLLDSIRLEHVTAVYLLSLSLYYFSVNVVQVLFLH